MFTRQQGKVLVRLARQTIEERLGLSPADPVDPADLADPDLQEQRAVFVTLHKQGRLRGCIGSLVATQSIVDGVRSQAHNAAFHDPRFSPVSREELGDLRIEISILSEPGPLDYSDGDDLVAKLRPGIDGVILRHRSGAGATFLPQVWEQLPDAELFLAHLCRKAGLQDDAWRHGGLEIQTYQVHHFTEE